MHALFYKEPSTRNLRSRLHWNGSKRNRTQVGTNRPCVYTGTDGIVPYITIIRTQTGPPRK